MSKQRYVDTRFWDDTYICTLDPSEKLLFLYLLTNPLTNICGIYEISMKRIVFDTGFNQETVERILARFERDGKVLYRSGWVAMKNFIKHQNLNNPKIQAGIDAAMAETPMELSAWIKAEDKSSISHDNLSHLNSNSNTNSNTNTNGNGSRRGSKKTDPRGTEAKECLDYYFQRHVEVRSYKPTIVGKRDMELFKTLLRNYDVAAVKEIIDTFFGWKQRRDFTTGALFKRADVLYGVLKDKAEGKR